MKKPLQESLGIVRNKEITNYLELQALLLGLQSPCVDCSGSHILRSDNTSTVSHINAMGGIKPLPCIGIATVIWD